MTTLETLQWWCQKTLPLVYENSLSFYELLGKVIDYTNDLVANNNDIITQLTADGVSINELQTATAALQTELDNVKNGKYISLYLDSLISWINQNLQNLVASIAKFVWFGLNDDGHFVAYIPDNWKGLHFDTIIDTNNPNYGCLVLNYNEEN